ncbi:MAG: phosphoenolpyruvate--protein phosphotransferase [Spirochaetaceae bacterium]|nr:MAG: phosphoenolpyruvate--protein phosphotransferase [Spirochaetaceae bacterium]
MDELVGISAAPGIAIGTAFLYLDTNPTVPRYNVAKQDFKREIARFHEAVDKAREEIRQLKERQNATHSADQLQFLDSHLLMLDDREFIDTIERKLYAEEFNVEWILFSAMRGLIAKLDAAEDSYLRERTADIHDVARRVLNHLLARERISLADLTEEVVLVTHDLLPSDAISMNKRMVKGIAMDAGGRTSHTAILARSFEIPAVLGLSNITRQASFGDRIIVDGNRGKVLLRPNQKTEKRYLLVQQEWRKREVRLMGLNELAAETRDGKLIMLKANIEVPEEVDSIAAHGADGIGLYRSEFLFLRDGASLDEEEQYKAYSYVLEALGDKPVTIRTLDVGGDKFMPGLYEVSERNPILGWRAVRFCLAQPKVFETQLRALLRASMHGNLRIMFPMISGIEELNLVSAVLDDVRAALRREGVPFRENIPVGIMIEVPSAAVTSDILAKKSDFFSIGTNDLIQYTIAVDRGNERIAYLYEPFHPGVLRLIKMVIDNAHAVGLSAGMCGEMAGDPLAALILLGLGLDEFSMSASGIPEVKRIIRSVSMSEAEELVGTVLEMKSFEEIDSFVQDVMEKRFDVQVY